MDLLDTEGDAPPRRPGRSAVVAALAVAVGAAAWIASGRDGGTPPQEAPALRLSVDGFTTSGTVAEVDYSVTNEGRRPVRLVDVDLEDDAARVTALRVPSGDIPAGQSAGVTIAVRFSCAAADTRPLQPALRLTTVTADGRRQLVAPDPDSELTLDVGGGSLLTGPATAPCSACLDVLDALDPVDAETHAADLRAQDRAARGGAPVAVPGVVEQAERTVRAARPELPADQAPLAAEALAALEDVAADGAAAAAAFAVLDRVREDLDDRCDPAVPEVLR